ncbi:hypothetical protein KQX54_020809 [Cotesia glomerata]|uniref:Uncharacterized protein n=1 Tax=Cotesia glomerata TaxID=32391 RepID=A0AAV7I4Z1_COTGL|nr:hypothetical protein KQX54_020809 [Cotesia glomerata]
MGTWIGEIWRLPIAVEADLVAYLSLNPSAFNRNTPALILRIPTYMETTKNTSISSPVCDAAKLLVAGTPVFNNPETYILACRRRRSTTRDTRANPITYTYILAAVSIDRSILPTRFPWDVLNSLMCLVWYLYDTVRLSMSSLARTNTHGHGHGATTPDTTHIIMIITTTHMYVCVQKGTSASMLSRISLEKSHALINVVRSVRDKGIKPYWLSPSVVRLPLPYSIPIPTTVRSTPVGDPVLVRLTPTLLPVLAQSAKIRHRPRNCT